MHRFTNQELGCLVKVASVLYIYHSGFIQGMKQQLKSAPARHKPLNKLCGHQFFLAAVDSS